MGPRAGLDRCGKSHPHWDSIPGPSSPWPVTVPTELSWPLCIGSTFIKNVVVLVPLILKLQNLISLQTFI